MPVTLTTHSWLFNCVSPRTAFVVERVLNIPKTMIITESSYTEQIFFAEQKLSALPHAVHAQIYMQVDVHTTYAHRNGLLIGLWKGLSTEECLELGTEIKVEILQTGRQRIPDRGSDETEKALTIRFQIAFRNFQNLLGWGSECWICLIHMCRINHHKTMT